MRHLLQLNKAFGRNTLRVLGSFVNIPLSHGRDDPVDQSPDGLCSSNLLALFQASRYPYGGAETKRVWLNAPQSGPRPLLAVETPPVPHLCRLQVKVKVKVKVSFIVNYLTCGHTKQSRRRFPLSQVNRYSDKTTDKTRHIWSHLIVNINIEVHTGHYYKP